VQVLSPITLEEREPLPRSSTEPVVNLLKLTMPLWLGLPPEAGLQLAVISRSPSPKGKSSTYSAVTHSAMTYSPAPLLGAPRMPQ